MPLLLNKTWFPRFRAIYSKRPFDKRPFAVNLPTLSPRQSIPLLAVLLIVLFLLSLLIGRYPAPGLITPNQIMEDELAQRLIFNLRLPRLLTAVLLGMTLAAAGMVFQLLFSNPLVEPGFLGVSQGAAFGAAFAIIFLGGAALATQVGAGLFALAGLGISYLLARRLRFGGWVLRLVLAGIAVSALFSAGLGILKYLADPLTQLQEITFWLLGSLSSITWSKLLSVLPVSVIGLTIIYLYRWRLNLLSLNEQTSFSLGVAPGRERWLLIFAAVLPTAALISISGMIGWVGLIIPHIARRLFHADTRYSLPAAMLLGGIFTMLCDNVARALFAGEIPLGILTSLFGAVIFLLLMSFQPTRPRS
ncbi:MAG: iron ABC transporter permease [Chloroflexi bacterium]|nr:iron ABC transporter permease [Ardenticatenaceae bacterium]MBL1129406.1 iron ABC transporter permease [Chloroflexota bacterium]NOG35486.1 iron ABC transporter permease [Chloroflexota bacterium]GIK57435.1 MAG: iron ABC transporter permease [Chloroflexota bacterium]